MSFSIKFLDKQTKDSLDKFQIGEITINKYTETFQASLSYWNKTDYIYQWKNAIKHILKGNKKSCFVTSMFNPKTANYIFLWSMYVEKNIVHIQNKLLFFQESSEFFDESCIYSYISDRETVTEDGYKISEWDIYIEDLQEFLGNYEENKN